jgi:hypothetical protein
MTERLDAPVDTSELLRYIVQIRSDVGAILGTGFFVAQSWALTCAHVVHNARTVMVIPDASVSNTPLAASVDAASPAPGPGAASSLWPFPDLALLHLAGDVQHPCAFLDTDGPVSGSEVQAWGYPEREPGVVPEGAPASFQLEGGPGEDGWLKFKAGEAAPGLSGAPLVCPRRRAVVGVVTATRQRHSDMGGYATPVSLLLNGDKRLPADLAAHAALIRVMNVRAVLGKDARTWHRVLPVPDAKFTLKPLWRSFEKGESSNPSDLLLPEYGVVPYSFRGNALGQAAAWCDQDQRFAVARVLGGVGTGKTRFARELCKSMASRGWMAGLWRRDKQVAQFPLPRLVVVDFTEVDDLPLVWQAINDLEGSASEIAPVRVLLLTRTKTEAQLPDAADVLTPGWDIDGACSDLDISERQELFKTAAKAFARAWHAAPDLDVLMADAEARATYLREERYAAPLEVLFEALDLALGGQPSSAGPALSPVERILDRERRFWERAGPNLDLSWKEAVVTLSTLAGAETFEEAVPLLASIPALPKETSTDWRRLVTWHANLYGGSTGIGMLHPVRPDRLGETLVSQFLENQHDGGESLVTALLSLASDYQVARCLDVLARLVAAESSGQRPGAQRARSFQPVKAALVRCSDDLKRRAVRRQPDTRVPNPIAGSYERLVGALDVIEQRREAQQREVRAREELADKSAREEKTRRDISDSVSMLDSLRNSKSSETPNRQAIPTPAQSKAAHERAELNQRIEELEHELTIVKQARQEAQEQVQQFRSERVDLDKLIELRGQLEAQLREQLNHVAEEQRRREEADAYRKQAEQREGTVQQQLETQFLRAQHEQLEREKAERALRDVAGQLDQAENDWDIQSYAVRREVELRLEAEKAKESVQVKIAELETEVSGLQVARRRLQYTTYVCGVFTLAALLVIFIVLI